MKESEKTAQEPGQDCSFEQLYLGQIPSLSALLQALLCSTGFGCPSIPGVRD